MIRKLIDCDFSVERGWIGLFERDGAYEVDGHGVAALPSRPGRIRWWGSGACVGNGRELIGYERGEAEWACDLGGLMWESSFPYVYVFAGDETVRTRSLIQRVSPGGSGAAKIEFPALRDEVEVYAACPREGGGMYVLTYPSFRLWLLHQDGNAIRLADLGNAGEELVEVSAMSVCEDIVVFHGCERESGRIFILDDVLNPMYGDAMPYGRGVFGGCFVCADGSLRRVTPDLQLMTVSKIPGEV